MDTSEDDTFEDDGEGDLTTSEGDEGDGVDTPLGQCFVDGPVAHQLCDVTQTALVFREDLWPFSSNFDIWSRLGPVLSPTIVRTTLQWNMFLIGLFSGLPGAPRAATVLLRFRRHPMFDNGLILLIRGFVGTVFGQTVFRQLVATIDLS